MTSTGAASDHSGLLLRWGVKCARKTHKRSSKVTKWDNLINIEDRDAFNSSVRDAVTEECSLEFFCETLVSSGKEVLEIEEVNDPGWFELSKATLRPLFDVRNNLLFKQGTLAMTQF